MADEVQFILSQYREYRPPIARAISGGEEHSPPPSQDTQRDEAIFRAFEQEAAEMDLEFKRGLKPGSSGFTGFSTFWEIASISGPYIAYAGGAAAGIVVFIRNALGSAAEWKKLREGRTISIDVKGKKIEIKDGVTVDEVLKEIKAALGIDDK
ncbi:hypothetical protein [Bradyrhizobium icense]|uniref:Uncharacterized protein n=1 Tax=Bradyrhizobium icense TaxID=1274631 RepID=A0A1B1UBJ2_9BRAD|nr:hypothetical protein [Bradyrhizobium icense]ANW00113.1 hypothetical protein LMTR13_07850 [Bradyrhizobium icense]